MEHISDPLARAARDLRNLMPPEVRQRWDEEARKEARYIERLRAEAAETIERLAEAIRRPKCCRVDLEEAEKHLARALSIAAILDPEQP